MLSCVQGLINQIFTYAELLSLQMNQEHDLLSSKGVKVP